MKLMVLFLIGLVSLPAFAKVDCGLHRIKAFLSEDIQTLSRYEVVGIIEVPSTKSRLWKADEMGYKRKTLRKVDMAAEGILGGCGGELEIRLVHHEQKAKPITAICEYAEVVNSKEAFFALDRCEEFTEDKGLAQILNTVGRSNLK